MTQRQFVFLFMTTSQQGKRLDCQLWVGFIIGLIFNHENRPKQKKVFGSPFKFTFESFSFSMWWMAIVFTESGL